MHISPRKKAKLRYAFNEDLHPRYPIGHPLGGSAEQWAIANGLWDGE